MKININLRTVIAFIALLLVMHELHEIVHTAVGRVLCGCWGPRDFNVWGLCEDCAVGMPWTMLTTIAGPVFTFGIIWIGYYLLKAQRPLFQQSVGFALVFGNMPIARIITAATGGGDEVYALQELFADRVNESLLWLIGLFIVLILSIPPLVRAWKWLDINRRLWIYTGFLILPFVFDVAVVLIGMNGLLEMGVLDQQGLIGSPILLNLWTLLWVGMLAGFGSYLARLFVPAESMK